MMDLKLNLIEERDEWFKNTNNSVMCRLQTSAYSTIVSKHLKSLPTLGFELKILELFKKLSSPVGWMIESVHYAPVRRDRSISKGAKYCMCLFKILKLAHDQIVGNF